MKKTGFLVAALLVLAGHVLAATFSGLANTPPMGYNPWNVINTVHTEAQLLAQADLMNSLGLTALGYKYVEMDDGAWSTRTAGVLVSDPTNWPSLVSFTAHVHANGQLAGMYFSTSTTTCAGHPGSLGHEYPDAALWAADGGDGAKVDTCGSSSWTGTDNSYITWSAAITTTGRPMMLRVCYLASFSPNVFILPGMIDTFRTSGDIGNTFAQVISNFQSAVLYHLNTGPGIWGDPDLLEIGNGVLNNNQEKAQQSYWAEEAAPLMFSTDLSAITAPSLAVLSNPYVIAVDQDTLGVAGFPVRYEAAGVTVYARPIYGPAYNTRWSVVLGNSTPSTVTMTAYFQDCGLTGTVQVNDLWQSNAIVQNTPGMTSYTAAVAPFGVVHLALSGNYWPAIGASFYYYAFTAQGIPQNMTAGAQPYNLAGWQSLSFTATAPNTQVYPLVETSGYSDGAVLSATAANGAAYNTPSPSFTDGGAYLYNAWLDCFGGSTTTVKVAGIPAIFQSLGYLVRVYFNDASSNRGEAYQFNGVSGSANSLGAYSGTYQNVTCWACAGNYYQFQTQSASSFTLLTWPNSGGTLRAPVNGLQIIANSAVQFVNTPSVTPTATPTATPSATPSATPTITPSRTPTPGATATPGAVMNFKARRRGPALNPAQGIILWFESR